MRKKIIKLSCFLMSIFIFCIESNRSAAKSLNEIYTLLKDTIKVTVTVYNPDIKQCNSDYLYTADGSYIDTIKLKNEEIKWIAVSRDLLKYVNFNDTITLHSDKNQYVNGTYIVHDIMNRRWTNRIDILSHKDNNNKIGKTIDVNTSIVKYNIVKAN